MTSHASIGPDLIISGGPILSMDQTAQRLEAVAVTNGRIVATGSLDQVRSLSNSRTKTIKLDGRTLMPGLIDPHMHAAMVQMADWVDISPMTTPDANSVLKALRTATPSSTGWIIAKLFDPSITHGHPHLDRSVLDTLSPHDPVLVFESNGHIAYVNSAAMREAGVDRHTPDPPQSRFERDAGGELTGRLEESGAVAAFARGMPEVSREELLSRHKDLLWRAAGRGVTLLHDCSIGALIGEEDINMLRSVVDDVSPVRYRGMLVSTLYDTWEKLGLQPGFGNDMLRIDGVKAWSDGSNQARTGFQRAPYLNSSERGSLNYSPEELAAVVDRAHRAGWQIGVHANGDAAIDVTLDAFERALEETPVADHCHRIEHCSLLHDDQISRMRTLGLSPSFLIGHIRWWGTAFQKRILGPERAELYDRCASAIAAGLRISLHSDWNVTPLEPLRYVEDAVTRVMAESGDVLNGDERIPVEAALRAVTIDAAWQCRADGITGSIEVGKYADFAILEEDPTRVDATAISRIPVSATLLAGELRYSR